MLLISNRSPFSRHTLELLTSFQSGLLIDTSSGSSSLPYRAFHAIKSLLKNLTLHDAWQTLHPNVKDFTFFSPPHNTYSRIDNFFLSQSDLEYLVTANIDPMILPDHHPISITITFTSMPSRSHIWRLDNSILTDPENIKLLNTCLFQYFREN